jgi:hypothetical protein
MESIPLSWSRSDIEYPEFETVKLPLSGLSWIHSAEVPHNYSFEELHEELRLKFGRGFLIRGCSREIARYLARNGFDAVRTGAEGVIDLGMVELHRPSLKELVRRGRRWGGVREIPFTKLNQERVYRFSSRTAYGNKPRLNYLFLPKFSSTTRCFVFSTEEDKWLGAVTVSTTAHSRAHTELILRDVKAPPGVMEALFVEVMNILRDDAYEKFSLGEVPFVTPQKMDSVSVSSMCSVKEKMLFKLGRILKFAFDYTGLFQFKNKFHPEWKPVYICANPGLSYSAMTDVFFVSRYFDLSRSELVSTIKGYSLSLLKNLRPARDSFPTLQDE